MLLLSVFAFVACASAATRRFAIEAQWGSGAPDGFQRQMILVNGSSPGPALVVDQGDNVEFFVYNGLDAEATVHFHGIEQLDTPWSDGVPGLSQRPIAPGSSFLYKWTANEYGAYWYHAHYQSQVSDGFYGPIYIRPRSSLQRPFNGITNDPQALDAIQRAEDNPQFVMVADWQHITQPELWDISTRTNIDMYCAQSLLFNGKGSVPCLTPEQQHAVLAPPFQKIYAQGGPLAGQNLTANGCAPFTGATQNPGRIDPSGLPKEITGCQATNAGLSDFRVNPADQWANFHLMSANSVLAPVISIDGHDLWVYAVDGRYIEPYKVQGVQIYSGERYSVMVPLNQAPGTYTFRASHFGFNQLLSGYATVTYTNAGSDGGSNGGSNGGGRPGGGVPRKPAPGGRPSSPGGRPPPAGSRPPQPRQLPPGYGQNAPQIQGYIQQGIDLIIPPLNGDPQRPNSGSPSSGSPQSDSSESGNQKAWFTYAGFPVSQDVKLLNTTTDIRPFPNVPPSRNVDATYIFHMSRFQAPYIWTVSGEAAYPSHPKEYAEDNPMLYFPNSQEAQNRGLVVRTHNDTWVDLVFAVVDPVGPPHPMHKHSNKAYVIGKGVGNWTWNSVAEAAAAQPQNFNFEAPPLRDGYATEPSAGQPVWLVVRYHVENPGAFMLHCHTQTHLAGGMAIALLDAVEDFPPIPPEYSLDRNGT